MVPRISSLARRIAAASMTLTVLLCGGSSPANAQTTAAAVHHLAPGPIYSVFPGVGDAIVPGPVHAAFLGDSYTFGVGANVRTDGYAYRVARAEHWSADVVGLPGSGYVRVAEKDDKRISAGVASVIAAQPQVVVVECGHNDADLGIDLARVEPSALRDLRRLRAGLPDATIVVVGPVWLSGHPDSRVIAVRNAVHAAQRRIPGSLWIDPIAQRWFTGNFERHTGDDATMINYAVGHPDDAGYRHIARLLERDLRSLGVR